MCGESGEGFDVCGGVWGVWREFAVCGGVGRVRCVWGRVGVWEGFDVWVGIVRGIGFGMCVCGRVWNVCVWEWFGVVLGRGVGVGSECARGRIRSTSL